MRFAGLAALSLAWVGSAFAQTPPTANQVAAAEVAIHCTEIAARAEADIASGNPDLNPMKIADHHIEPIRIRYVKGLENHTGLATYTSELTAARRAIHKQRVATLKPWQVSENVTSCTLGDAPIPLMSFLEMPTAPFALAMAGRGPNDVLYIDTADLYRNGGAVAGWQLYVFRADQMVDGKPTKAQWTPFRVSCIGTPEITTYGSAWLADPKQSDLAFIHKIGEGSRKAVVAGSFGAATWMIACGVTPTPQTYPTLAAAADHTAAVYAQLQQQTPAPQ